MRGKSLSDILAEQPKLSPEQIEQHQMIEAIWMETYGHDPRSTALVASDDDWAFYRRLLNERPNV